MVDEIERKQIIGQNKDLVKTHESLYDKQDGIFGNYVSQASCRPVSAIISR